MPRLCSESSRPYPGRSARLSRALPGLYKRPVRPLVDQAWAHRSAAGLCERMRQQTAREPWRAHGVILGVIGQKSAEAIVAKCPG